MSRKVSVTAYPNAIQFGEIEVPDEVEDKDLYLYISDHFNDISFGEPDLGYAGIDFDID